MSRYRQKSLKKSFSTERQNKKKKTDFAFALVIAITNALPSIFNLIFNLHAIALFLAPVPDLTLLCAADQFLPRQSRITVEFVFPALLI
jgi:hypothetical protein